MEWTINNWVQRKMNKKNIDKGLSFNSISVMIDKTTFSEVQKYLLSHESDIAIDFEDFGVLQGLFRSFIGRYPENSCNKTNKKEV